MEGRSLGCRVSMLGCAGVAVFVFFGMLMSFSDGALRTVVAKRQQKDVEMDLALLNAALHDYAIAHEGKLPPMETPEALKKALYPGLVATESFFTRLGDNAPYQPNPKLSGKTLTEIKDPEKTPLLSEPPTTTRATPGKQEKAETKAQDAPPPRAILYADGIIRKTSAGQQ